jgi:uncharacterized protein (TIGR00255 family)
MTGYARIRQQTASGELTVSLRTVNHRALDFHFHQGSEFFPFENSMRALLKQNIARGHVEIRVALNRSGSPVAQDYNRDVVSRYVSGIRQASTEFGVPCEPDLNAAFRLPGAFASESAPVEIDPSFEPEFLAALAQCAAELNAFREREGSQLAELLRQESLAIRQQTERMISIRAGAIPLFQNRLAERLEALLAGAGLDPRRLAEEAAVLADRSDIQEELARLDIHTRQLDGMLSAGGELGKKIDFLLQEMNRETNTILSKTSGIGETGLAITDLALATKANVERIREQALNIE